MHKSINPIGYGLEEAKMAYMNLLHKDYTHRD